MALLFPGQGCPLDDMRDLVARLEPDLLRVATETVGSDPFADAANSTASAQPAIVCASLALVGELADDGPGARHGAWHQGEVAYAAGHSLGELTALCAAGAIQPNDAVRLAAARGRAMQESADAAPGGMVALIGDADAAADLASAHGWVIANINSPGQNVAAGPLEAIDAIEAEAADHDLRALRLPVAGAFHTQAMESAVPALRRALGRTNFTSPRFTVYSCATAAPFPSDPQAIREALAAALVQPVRWQDTVLALRAAGADDLREVGPGRALTGMVKRIDRQAKAAVGV